MKTHFLILMVAGVTGCLSASVTPDAKQEKLPAGLTKEVTEAVEWYDSLGLPPVKGLTRVRIVDSWSDTENKNKGESYVEGWLLEEKAGKWRVLAGTDVKGPFQWDGEGPWPLEEWTVSEYDKTEKNWKTARRVQKVEFKAGEEMLADLKSNKKWEDRIHSRFGLVLSQRAAVFITGRECLARGLTDTGTELLKLAPPLDRDVNETRTFRELLNDELAISTLWKITLEFGAPAISRKTILGELEAALKRFPSSHSTPDLQKMADRLRSMITDDTKHAVGAKAFDAMTPAEQVAELIFQLRDQHGEQWSQPGWCDFFSGDSDEAKGTAPSPAARLVKVGYAAVPALIEAMGSEDYTRSVGFWRDFRFSHTVLTVGDCAEATLARIAKRSFYAPKTTSGYMSRDKKTAAIREEVNKWWKNIQVKGEKQALIEATEAGDAHSPDQAAVLLELYPDAAEQALLTGAGKCREWWPRTRMLELLDKLKSEKAVAFLKNEMTKGPHTDTRCAAMRLMLPRDRNAAAKAMAEEWDRYPGPLKYSDPLFGGTNFGVGGDFDQSDWEDRLKKLLVMIYLTGGPNALNAVGSSYAQKPLWIRLVAARTGLKDTLKREGEGLPALPPAEEKDTEVAMESLLFTVLEDKEERTCDMAAEILHERWPAKYAFEDVDSQRRRDAQIVAIKNVRRKAEGLPELPTPAKVEIAAADEKTAGPLLDNLAAAKNKTEVDQAMRALESGPGLGSLPLVRKRLEALPKDDAGAERWQQAMARLACLVRAVEFDEKAPFLTKMKELPALKGKVLTTDLLQTTLAALYHATPEEVAGFRFDADREDDGCGFVIRITPSTKTSSGLDEWWAKQFAGNRYGVSLGDRGLYGIAKRGPDKDEFDNLKKAFVKSAAQWDRPVYLSYRPVRQERR